MSVCLVSSDGILAFLFSLRLPNEPNSPQTRQLTYPPPPPAYKSQVCGDFNSDVRSAVYELMSTQGVSPDHPDLSNDPCNVLPDASELTHSE